MRLACQHPVGGADDVRIGIRLNLEDPIRIAALHRRLRQLPLDDLAQDRQRQRAGAEHGVMEATDVEPIALPVARLGAQAEQLEQAARLERSGRLG